MGEKPVVLLWKLNGLGLIISHPTGVTYACQTGGYACHERKLEGALVPIFDKELDQQAQLLDLFFTGPKWRGHCYAGIDEETADAVDAILASSSLTKMLKVDRAKLQDSHEAWICVVFPPSCADRDFNGFPSGNGILTWENSD